MGKSSPSPPPPPSPAQTAQQQSTANVNTAAAQAALDYVNVNSPYGSTTFNPTGNYTTPGGDTVPTYTENVSLSPLGQSILTGEQGVANTLIPAAQNIAGTAAQSASTPLNLNTPFSDTLNKSPQLLNQDAVNAVYGQQKSFLDPQWDQQQKQLENQLSQQGIPVGSDAYNNAMKEFFNSKTQAYQAAQDTAIATGAQNANQMFNLALAGQQANIGQQELAQTEPIGVLQSLMGAAPPTPTQPVTTPSAVPISPTDLIGATGLSTNAAMQGYQAQLAAQNANNGATAGLFGSLGSAAILALALSDRRLKTDIVRDGVLPSGIPIYVFRFKGDDTLWRGVMADEVERVMPDAVVYNDDGYAMVDYGKIGYRMHEVRA